ncbi:MAG: hypothetical protein KatS3mg035_2099 [Bacteroidia bacterium]|nr:MAG: hypothetical protein KatS3mg035_2099 [Bacteroidia bacterium]
MEQKISFYLTIGALAIVFFTSAVTSFLLTKSTFLVKENRASSGGFGSQTARITHESSPSSQYHGSDKFGQCDGFSSRTISEDIQDTKALGFGWGRPLGDVFSQETVERDGSFDFSVPDRIVQDMQNSGIKIFGTLFPTGIPRIPNSVDIVSFGQYVRATLQHYKGQITYWQVGIEPFCQTKSETCYKNFFELTKTAYQVAKSVDPSIKISPGGSAPIYDMHGRIDEMSEGIFGYFFRNGGINYMDFFNFHYLVGKEEPSVAKYVNYWKQYVGEKEMWLSETGSRDVGDRFTISADENQEYQWVKKHITDSFQNGIAKIFWCRAEHSYSDMPKVVEALQSLTRQYGGYPTGSVVKRQTKPGSMMRQGNQEQIPGSGVQQQPGGMQDQISGGYCGDNKCDSIEQQSGGCPSDCR